MDAAAALADLTEISSQVQAAVVVDGDGAVLAAEPPGSAGGEQLARAGVDLLRAAEEQLPGPRRLTQIEVGLREGSVFVAREAGRTIVARTSPSPSSGLVLHDLGACLGAIAAADTPKRARRAAPRKKQEETADA